MARSSAVKGPEELALMKQCLDEGWSMAEMKRTYGWGREVIKKYYPDAGWSFVEGARLGAFILHSSRSS